jgi:hypothetical protein
MVVENFFFQNLQLCVQGVNLRLDKQLFQCQLFEFELDIFLEQTC